MNILDVTPLVIDIAVNSEGFVRISGESDNSIPAKDGFQSVWFENNAEHYLLTDVARSIKKLTNDVVAGHEIKSLFTLERDKPFAIAFQSASFEIAQYNMFGGLVTDTGKLFMFAHGHSGTGYSWNAQFNSNQVLPTVSAQPLESWQINSDGAVLTYRRGGIIVYTAAIPTDVLFFKSIFAIAQQDGSIYNINIQVPATIEIVNAETVIKTFLPDSGNLTTRNLTPNVFGIKPTASGNKTLVIGHPSSGETKIVSIRIANVYIRPKNNENILVVQENDIVSFETNAVGGLMTASSGLVDNYNLQWQAVQVGNTTISYAFGQELATYRIEVIPRVRIAGVEDGYHLIPMIQGETLQLVSNVPNTVFTCLNYENVITNLGSIIAPNHQRDDFFGKKTLHIRARVHGINKDFYVEILPMYPTPEFGGVISQTWIKELADKLPISKKTVGGKKEARNQNTNGVTMWRIEYTALRRLSNACEASLYEKRFDVTRLDAFYNLVSTTDYFSLVDYHTREVFRYVTFERCEIGDQESFRHDQSRTVELYYDGGAIQL